MSSAWPDERALTAYDALVELMVLSRNDPAFFILNVLRTPEWTDTRGRERRLRRWQEKLLGEIRSALLRGERHIEVVIRTAHGSGKTFLLSALLWWIIATRKGSRILTTAQSWSGVENLLWPEIHAHYRRSLIQGWGRLLNTEFYVQDTWYAVGAASDRPVNLEGHHSMTCAARIVDEAKAVEDAVFVSTEGILDAPETFDFWITTPALRTGRFFERDTGGDRSVIRAKVTIDELVEDGVPGRLEWRQKRLKEWGADSPFYRSRAMAEYIDVGDGSLYSMEWIEAAFGARWVEIGRPEVGLDVAGSAGGDESVMVGMWGPNAEGRFVARVIDSWNDPDTMRSKGRAFHLARSISALVVRVDTIGLGKGLYDALASDYNVESYRASDKPMDVERFENRKAEDAWLLRAALESGRLRLVGDKLRSQLVAMKYEITRAGRVRIVDPADSPDHHDALLIAAGRLLRTSGAADIVVQPGEPFALFAPDDDLIGHGPGDPLPEDSRWGAL